MLPVSPCVQLYDIAPSLVLITTAEPCPMCAGAIEWAGFAAVYYGSSIPFISSQKQNQVGPAAASAHRIVLRLAITRPGLR